MMTDEVMSHLLLRLYGNLGILHYGTEISGLLFVLRRMYYTIHT